MMNSLINTVTQKLVTLVLCTLLGAAPTFAHASEHNESAVEVESVESDESSAHADDSDTQDSEATQDDAQAGPDEGDEDTGPAIFDAVEERMAVNETVTPETTDLLGEQIDLSSGQISFTHVDISLPGNSTLPVTLQREYRGRAWLNNIEQSWGFADWQLAIPHVKTNIADDQGNQPANNPWYTGQQCSRATDPGIVADTGLSYLEPADYFSGVTLNVPGQVNDLLLSSFAPTLTTLADSHLVTKSNWQTRCDIPLTQGATGQGFNVTSPDGVVYTFDKFKKIKKYSPGRLSKTSHYDAYTFVSKVQDRFGHWVKYDYDDKMRLTAIYAKDGRRIDIAYKADNDNLIESVYVNKGKTTERRWQYHYSSNGHALKFVTLPNETQWSFSLGTINSLRSVREAFANHKERYTNDICEHITRFPEQYPETNISLTHPNGTKGTFTMKVLSHHRANVTSNIPYDNNSKNPQWDKPYCSYNHAIQKKVLSGPGLSDLTWAYQYAQHKGYYHRVRIVNVADRLVYIAADGKVSSSNVLGPHNQFSLPGKTLPSMVAGATQDYRYTQVTAPDNSQTLHFFDRNFDHATENREVASDYYDVDGTLLQRIETTYRAASFSGEHGVFSHANRSVVDNLKPKTHRVDPIKRTIIHYTADGQQDTFVTEYLAFNDFGIATEQVEYQGLTLATAVKKRYTISGFQDDTDTWVLNLPTTRHVGTTKANAKRVSETTYHDENTAGGLYQGLSLPYESKGFGDWQQRYTAYDTNGNVATLQYNQKRKKADGSDVEADAYRYISYKNYKRGRPQTIEMPARYSDTGKLTYSAVVDDNGWVTSTTDAKKITTAYAYDGMGRLTAIERDSGNQRWFGTYIQWQQNDGETLKRIAQQCLLNDANTGCVGPVAFTSQTEYDALLRPVLTTTTDGHTSRYHYQQFNAYNKVTLSAYPSETALTVGDNTPGIRYSYDGLQRLTQVHQSGGGTVKHRYLSANRIEVTDGQNNVTTTGYLAYGSPSDAQALQIKSAGIVTTDLTVNVYGDITQIRQTPPPTDNEQPPVGQVEYRAYDAEHRLCKVSRSDVGTTVFERNVLGEVQWQAQGVSGGNSNNCTSNAQPEQKVSFNYDNLGQLWQVDYGDIDTSGLRYALDNNGNVLSITASTFSQHYTYNSLNLLEDETLNIPSDNKSFTLDYGYNAQGHPSSIQYPDGEAAIDFAPNGFGQPTQAIRTYADNTPGVFVKADAKYYPSGLLKSFYYGNNIQYQASQNARQMPEQVTDTLGDTALLDLTYDYDNNSNITSIENPRENGAFSLTALTYDGLDRLKTTAGGDGIGNSSLTYDHLGNIKTYSNTSLFKSHDLTYDYGSDMRLKSLTGTGSEGYDFAQANAENADNHDSYDARGNVIHNGKHDFNYNLANQMTASGNNRYLYDGHNRRIKSHRTLDERGISYSVYSQSGTLLYRETTAGGINYVYFGSKLVAKEGTGVTSQSDSIMHYKPFGESIETAKDDVGYTGHKFDIDLDLSYMQQRYYDPLAGRFYSNDPIGYRDVHSFNRYVYANNNPYKFIDPDGRTSTPYSMVQNAQKVAKLDAGKPQSVVITRHAKMFIGTFSAALSGGGTLPLIAGVLTFSDGAAEGSVVSSALQKATVPENIAKGVASGVDVALGVKGLADGTMNLGKALVASDDTAAAIIGATTMLTAESTLTQAELSSNLDNVANIAEPEKKVNE